MTNRNKQSKGSQLRERDSSGRFSERRSRQDQDFNDMEDTAVAENRYGTDEDYSLQGEYHEGFTNDYDNQSRDTDYYQTERRGYGQDFSPTYEGRMGGMEDRSGRSSRDVWSPDREYHHEYNNRGRSQFGGERRGQEQDSWSRSGGQGRESGSRGSHDNWPEERNYGREQDFQHYGSRDQYGRRSRGQGSMYSGYGSEMRGGSRRGSDDSWSEQGDYSREQDNQGYDRGDQFRSQRTRQGRDSGSMFGSEGRYPSDRGGRDTDDTWSETGDYGRRDDNQNYGNRDQFQNQRGSSIREGEYYSGNRGSYGEMGSGQGRMTRRDSTTGRYDSDNFGSDGRRSEDSSTYSAQRNVGSDADYTRTSRDTTRGTSTSGSRTHSNGERSVPGSNGSSSVSKSGSRSQSASSTRGKGKSTTRSTRK